MAVQDDDTRWHGADALVVPVAGNGLSRRTLSRDLAHLRPGVLHLAVSIQIVDHDGAWVLQRRSGSKALFANRWTNTCCTHPRPGEDLLAAALRRLREEVGLTVTDAVGAGTFTYRALDPQTNLVEHEQDHVFVAVVDTAGAAANQDEVSGLVRLPFADALRLAESEDGTPWAHKVLEMSYAALHGS